MHYNCEKGASFHNSFNMSKIYLNGIWVDDVLLIINELLEKG